ncbi:MAG: HepT-like ribonuclease domain-containing protein [Candidatus Saccharimonadales bacterium]
MKSPEPLVGTAYDSLVILMKYLDVDKTKFDEDVNLQDATLMRLLAAGESLARVRDNYPDYYEKYHTNSWNNLIGLRNIIAHGYTKVDREKIWNISRQDVPSLLTELESLI